ncbi:MAG: peptidoglycan editing factor PgeF [Caldimicrobium sp.]
MLYCPECFQQFKINGYFSQKIPKKEISLYFPKVLFPKQIHSNKVFYLEKIDSSILEGDAIITTLKNLTIGVQTADCLPILVADKYKRVIGAVHAGWRGTLSGILKKTLEKILSLGIDPEDILIAIGPHIQSCCYEVGEDLIELLPDKFKTSPYLIKRDESFYLNLSLLNLFQAKDLGIPEKNIWISKECTSCNKEKYHSYRREKNYLFSQVSIITLKDV